jgi:hypothetical protein
MTIRVPCRCTVSLRLRWSKYLSGVLQQRAPAGTGLIDAVPSVHATVADDGSGWTVLTTRQPGVYVLRGSLGSGLFK